TPEGTSKPAPPADDHRAGRQRDARWGGAHMEPRQLHLTLNWPLQPEGDSGRTARVRAQGASNDLDRRGAWVGDTLRFDADCATADGTHAPPVCTSPLI